MFQRIIELIAFIKACPKRSLWISICIKKYYIWPLVFCLACHRRSDGMHRSTINTQFDHIMPVCFIPKIAQIMLPTITIEHIPEAERRREIEAWLRDYIAAALRAYKIESNQICLDGRNNASLVKLKENLIKQWMQEKCTYSTLMVSMHEKMADYANTMYQKMLEENISPLNISALIDQFYSKYTIHALKDAALQKQYATLKNTIAKYYARQPCKMKNIFKDLQIGIIKIAQQNSQSDFAQHMAQSFISNHSFSDIIKSRKEFCQSQKKIWAIYEHALSDADMALQFSIHLLQQNKILESDTGHVLNIPDTIQKIIALHYAHREDFAFEVVNKYIACKGSKGIDELIEEEEALESIRAINIDDLVNALSLGNSNTTQQPLHQGKKKKKNKDRKRNDLVSSNPAPIASASHARSRTKEEKRCENQKAYIASESMTIYTLHPRLKQWSLHMEKLDNQPIKKSKNQSEESVERQKCFHDIFMITDILNKADSNDYFFDTYVQSPTRHGKAAKATLTWKGEKYDGFVEIGMEKKEKNEMNIYHLMFKPCDPQSAEDAVSILTPNYKKEEESNADSYPADQWNDCSNQIKKENNNYVITFLEQNNAQPIKKLSIAPWSVFK